MWDSHILGLGRISSVAGCREDFGGHCGEAVGLSFSMPETAPTRSEPTHLQLALRPFASNLLVISGQWLQKAKDRPRNTASMRHQVDSSGNLSIHISFCQVILTQLFTSIYTSCDSFQSICEVHDVGTMFWADALVAAHKRVFHASFCTLGTVAWLQDHVALHNLNRLKTCLATVARYWYCAFPLRALQSLQKLFTFVPPLLLSRARSGIATLGWLSVLLCALLLWCSALCWLFCPLEVLHSCYGSCFLFSQCWLSSKIFKSYLKSIA